MCPRTASRTSRHAALVPGLEVCDRGADRLLAAEVMASGGLPVFCPELFIFRPFLPNTAGYLVRTAWLGRDPAVTRAGEGTR
jgi:hypothetical protein